MSSTFLLKLFPLVGLCIVDIPCVAYSRTSHRETMRKSLVKVLIHLLPFHFLAIYLLIFLVWYVVELAVGNCLRFVCMQVTVSLSTSNFLLASSSYHEVISGRQKNEKLETRLYEVTKRTCNWRLFVPCLYAVNYILVRL